MQQITKLWNSGTIGKLSLAVAGLIGVLVACCMLGLVLNTVNPRPQQTAARATAPAATNVPATVKPTRAAPTPQPMVAMGQEVQISRYIWKLLDATDLSASNPTADTETYGRLIKLRFEVTPLSQGGRGKANVVREIELIDTQGRKYEALIDIVYIRMSIEDNRCYITLLEDGKTKTCDAFYQVKKNAQGLQAVVRGFDLFGTPRLIQLQGL